MSSPTAFPSTTGLNCPRPFSPACAIAGKVKRALLVESVVIICDDNAVDEQRPFDLAGEGLVDEMGLGSFSPMALEDAVDDATRSVLRDALSEYAASKAVSSLHAYKSVDAGAGELRDPIPEIVSMSTCDSMRRMHDRDPCLIEDAPWLSGYSMSRRHLSVTRGSKRPGGRNVQWLERTRKEAVDAYRDFHHTPSKASSATISAFPAFRTMCASPCRLYGKLVLAEKG